MGVGVVGAAGGSRDGGSRAGAAGAPRSAAPEATTTTTTTPATTTTVADADAVPPLSTTLAEGLRSDDVLLLQQRLAEIGFDPGPRDGIFGRMTKQSVWAFEKLVLGTPRTEMTGTVDAATWEALFGDVRITPRRSTNGQADHTEVYLREQVLVVFQRDVAVLVTHISSGELDADGAPEEYCETATYDTDAQGRELDEPVTKQVCALAKTPGGVFTYDRQVEGKRISPLGGMWDPVYFNYGIAVHGAENVPAEPASHGCVRIPMHISEYFQSIISLGDRILVWNGDQEPEDVSERDSLPSFDYADPNATTTTTSTTTTTTPSAVADDTGTDDPSGAAPADPATPEPAVSTTTTVAAEVTPGDGGAEVDGADG
ncbi:peptidoglycan-binding protein [Ilumatobacter sp.]|uniref:peptidoglycan-binding protein n=1 Tax=Ilumatobacter sp. TaxID=1967498 RepID=UPI003B51B0C1